MVDPGAQDGCTGEQAYREWKEVLATYGLKPRELPLPQHSQCGGVGGSTELLGLADMPAGLASTAGIIRISVLKDVPNHAAPTLLPVNLMDGLKCNIDFDERLLGVKAFGTSTPMEKMPSGHFSVSLLDFPFRRLEIARGSGIGIRW